jgi:hypothetical protein
MVLSQRLLLALVEVLASVMVVQGVMVETQL